MYRVGVLSSLTTGCLLGERVTLPKRLNPVQGKGGHSYLQPVQNHPPPHPITGPHCMGCAWVPQAHTTALVSSDRSGAWAQILLSLEGPKVARPVPTNKPPAPSWPHRKPGTEIAPERHHLLGTPYYLPADPSAPQGTLAGISPTHVPISQMHSLRTEGKRDYSLFNC